jgi:hypothetical protein
MRLNRRSSMRCLMAITLIGSLPMGSSYAQTPAASPAPGPAAAQPGAATPPQHQATPPTVHKKPPQMHQGVTPTKQPATTPPTQ